MPFSLIVICHGCDLRQRPCAGPCACTIDGVDISIHAERAECPTGKFEGIAAAITDAPANAAVPLDIPLAGDVVESIAKRIGADRLAKWWSAKTGIPCGCEERKALLNAATSTLLRWINKIEKDKWKRRISPSASRD